LVRKSRDRSKLISESVERRVSLEIRHAFGLGREWRWIRRVGGLGAVPADLHAGSHLGVTT
jgi:hypothetical protein